MSHLSLNGSFSKFRKACKQRHNFSNLLATAALSVSISAGSLPVIAASESDSKSQVSSTTDGDASTRKVPTSKGKLIANVQPQEPEAKKGNATASDEGNGKEAQSYFEQERKARKRKYAHSSSTVYIYAPQAIVWKVLIDFEHYPEYFKRIDTCHITKREHGLLFAETYLKPQMFVKKLCQHTVSDISQGPNYLQWKMLDGNFTSVVGSWKLSTTKDKKGESVCEAEYTLEADPGPVIPSPLVSFLLHQVEHEVVTSFKKACEQNYKADDGKATAKKADKD
jgi:ribosome-associated toxin RatA of RatAB toxin-antitoxin module